MKSLVFSIIIMLLAITTNIANAQSENSSCCQKTKAEKPQLSTSENEKTSSAVVTFKTARNNTSEVLSEEILELTDYDYVLTEKIIYNIYKNRTTSIIKIVDDEKFDSVTEREQLEWIRESEVIEIINKLKN
jgi:hypothetical protein